MKRKRTCTTIQADSTKALVGIVRAAYIDFAAKLIRHFVGNSSSVDVYNTADRARAIKQCSWTFEDLDTLRIEWLNRRQVIGASHGNVHTVNPVFQCLDTCSAKAAYDRPADRLPKARGRNARNTAQGLGEGGRHRTLDFFAP